MPEILKLYEMDKDIIEFGKRMGIEFYTFRGQNYARGLNSQVKKFTKYLNENDIKYSSLVNSELNFIHEDDIPKIITFYKKHGMIPTFEIRELIPAEFKDEFEEFFVEIENNAMKIAFPDSNYQKINGEMN